MGVQSMDAGLLERLGRVHSREMVFRSVDALRAAGFDNLNLDLMFAIPGQSLSVWQATLKEILALGSEHLSCYEVIYEEDTPLYRQMGATRDDVAEELSCAMYDELVASAADAGYLQYEVANFARAVPGETAEFPLRACAHNVNYWRGGSFHGLGPSATGYVQGVRTRNVANTRLYCDALESGRRAIEWQESLAPGARAGEIAAFGLRTVPGWSFEEFRRVTGLDLREGWAAEMADLVARGWGRMDDTRFQLTREGFRFADAAGSEFLRP
jgi:oxygen-independent coproporphyrinogen-3 oxidase